MYNCCLSSTLLKIDFVTIVKLVKVNFSIFYLWCSAVHYIAVHRIVLAAASRLRFIHVAK